MMDRHSFEVNVKDDTIICLYSINGETQSACIKLPEVTNNGSKFVKVSNLYYYTNAISIIITYNVHWETTSMFLKKREKVTKQTVVIFEHGDNVVVSKFDGNRLLTWEMMH